MGLITPRNPLVYPNGTLPGINPNHVALSGATCRFAGVARNGNFFDLTRGIAGARTGTPTRAIDGVIGDSVISAAAVGMTFAGRFAGADQSKTFGAIVRWGNYANSTYSFIFANSTSTTGYNALFAGSDGSLNVRQGGINYGAPAGTITNNIPYFVAGSITATSPIFFVVARLDTGQITLYNPTGSGTLSGDVSNGSYVVGNWPSLSSFGMIGRIAAVAYTNAYLSLPQLLQWARAPWDFWYPPTLQQAVIFPRGRAAGPLISLSGNIGGYDQYGKLNYGKAAYSWSAVQPTLGGNLTPVLGLSGNLAPIVSFSGALSVTAPLVLSGNLAPVVTFAADLSFATTALSGGLAPQVTLGGSLGLILPIVGDLAPSVIFAASKLLSHSLWVESAPCPPPMWAESELCPNPMWIPLTAPGDLVYQSSDYGTANYGAYPYGRGRYVPAAASPWIPAELCHG